jgi:hypothetical protein
VGTGADAGAGGRARRDGLFVAVSLASDGARARGCASGLARRVSCVVTVRFSVFGREDAEAARRYAMSSTEHPRKIASREMRTTAPLRRALTPGGGTLAWGLEIDERDVGYRRPTPPEEQTGSTSRRSDPAAVTQPSMRAASGPSSESESSAGRYSYVAPKSEGTRSAPASVRPVAARSRR